MKSRHAADHGRGPFRHRYLISHIPVVTSRPLALLSTDATGSAPDEAVHIHFHARRWRPHCTGTEIPHGRANRDHCLYDIPAVGLLHVRDGREIHLTPRPELPDAVADLFVLGTGMGTIYHQRGLLPLHATVGLFGDRAYAFCAHSGEGKSTLGDALRRAGVPLLTDDVACIHWRDGRPMLAGEKPVIKLRPETLQHLRLKHPAPLDLPGGGRKSFLPLSTPTGLWPLAGIFILGFGELSIRPLSTPEALGTIRAHTYRNFLIEPIWGEAAFLKAQVHLIRAVPVARFHRPRDLNALGEVARYLRERLGD